MSGAWNLGPVHPAAPVPAGIPAMPARADDPVMKDFFQGVLRFPAEMMAGQTHLFAAKREWEAIWPGFQCRLASFGGENDNAWAAVEFRLYR